MRGRVTVRCADRVARIMLDRPTANNALIMSMLDELTRIVADLAHAAPPDTVVIADGPGLLCRF